MKKRKLKRRIRTLEKRIEALACFCDNLEEDVELAIARVQELENVLEGQEGEL